MLIWVCMMLWCTMVCSVHFTPRHILLLRILLHIRPMVTVTAFPTGIIIHHRIIGAVGIQVQTVSTVSIFLHKPSDYRIIIPGTQIVLFRLPIILVLLELLSTGQDTDLTVGCIIQILPSPGRSPWPGCPGDQRCNP